MYVGGETLDLRLTLIDSAQCFRWQERDGKFGAVIKGEPVWLWHEEDGLYAEGGSVELLRDYLDLGRDYGALAEEYASIPAASRAMSLYPGLRVLNQAPWDALVTFILSANNNVTRIRRLCDGLAEGFGQLFETEYGSLYALPSPEALAVCGETELRGLGMGYRAPYLIGTARRIIDGFPLDDLRNMQYDEAHARLTELPGVGDKVADCVLLFGCRHASAFPVDTWVEKLLKSWFGIEVKGRKKLLAASRAMLGAHAGLLQQFLFHAARTGGISMEKLINESTGEEE